MIIAYITIFAKGLTRDGWGSFFYRAGGICLSGKLTLFILNVLMVGQA